MGPSVKFVLPIIDAFPNKKMWVIFGVAKKDTTGGESEGVAFFGRNFSRPSFLNNSLRQIKCNEAIRRNQLNFPCMSFMCLL